MVSEHDWLLNEDEMLKAALPVGDNYQIEQMRAGGLRLGGVPASYAERLLVTGDAAAGMMMIDPMTGEGIRHAVDGGRNDGRADSARVHRAGQLQPRGRRRNNNGWWDDSR